jgi:hypothetical protein
MAVTAQRHIARKWVGADSFRPGFNLEKVDHLK